MLKKYDAYWHHPKRWLLECVAKLRQALKQAIDDGDELEAEVDCLKNDVLELGQTHQESLASVQAQVEALSRRVKWYEDEA